MTIEIGTRDQLLVDLAASLAPGEPVRLLVILRLGGFEEFAGKFGNGATEKLLGVVVSRLPPASGPSNFYYRPRKDELCGLIAGRLDGVEAALIAAAGRSARRSARRASHSASAPRSCRTRRATRSRHWRLPTAA